MRTLVLDLCTTQAHLSQTDILIILIVLCVLLLWYHGTIQHLQQDSRAFTCGKRFFTICPKKAPTSVFEHQFWCHFHRILPRYQFKNTFSNNYVNYIIPLVKNVMATLKSVKLILKYSALPLYTMSSNMTPSLQPMPNTRHEAYHPSSALWIMFNGIKQN